MTEWLTLARQPDVMLRAVKYAIVVGAVLIAINHGSAILRGQIDQFRVYQMCLTVIVPYGVSTASSVAAMRSARRRSTDVQSSSSRPTVR